MSAAQRIERRTVAAQRAFNRGFVDGMNGQIACPYSSRWAVESWREGYRNGRAEKGDATDDR